MTTALYRRYRPDTFTEVIGQEHVTEPLMQALRTDRVNHAYLFSGPRGCGKTTSARILARCLNCAEGPTPEPCGTCSSCVDLATGGPGSLDVVEIDAASHGGVDDARDLRERATFAPARDRFKIFILDEAHMVTSQGFNALLKIVEEPPPHVKFIFATTEPDKVIGTIRSRTHHYPFRLVGPSTLQPYLEQICATEGVAVGSGVLPLVVRAGGGSVRDSLSVLDQLVAGADESGIDYEKAVALLGFTHAALLDDVVDAIAARDGASAFRVVDRVVSSGHEPRRFVEDLLERLRDLIVIAASGEAAQAVLRDLPSDQLERMRTQASVLGGAELSRSADLVNTALTEMTGATSPRLHLELLVARLLLPAADDGALGLAARLDRVERELGSGTVRAAGAAAAPGAAAVPAAPVATAPAAAPVREVPVATARAAAPVPAVPVATVAGPPPAAAVTETAQPPAAPAAAPAEPAPAAAPAAAVAPGAPGPAAPRAPQPVAEAPEPVAPAADPEPVAAAPAVPVAAAPAVPVAATAPAATPPAAPPGPSVDAETVRRRWPEVLQTLRGLRMATWVLVSQNAQVAEVTGTTVALAFTTPQLATTFRTGPHPENVQRALHETLGLDVRIETTLAESATPAPTAPAPGATPAPVGPTVRMTTSQAEASWDAPAGATPPAQRAPQPSAPPAGRPDAAPADRATPAAPRAAGTHPAAGDDIPDGPEPDPEPGPVRPPVRATGRPQLGASRPVDPPPASRYAVDEGEDASPDDPDIASSGLVGAPLVAQMLGGTVVDEILDDPR